MLPDSFAQLHAEWRHVLDLLPEMLVAAEAAGSEEAANQLVLPMLTLQKCAEADPATRAALRRHIFAEGLDQPQGVDPYQPAGTLGWDPNATLGAAGSLRMHLLKTLTSTAHTSKHVCGNMLFAVCNDDPHDFAHLCGLGSAAGLLQERGLFAQFQDQMGAGGM